MNYIDCQVGAVMIHNSNIKKVFLFSLFCLSGLSNSIISAVKFEDTRGFERVLQRSWWMIHPLYGFIILRYSALLDNLFTYGDPKDPLIQVVKTLFHKDGELGTLQPSTSAANVACGLGPLETGWLFSQALTKLNAFKNPTPYQLKRSKAKLSKNDALSLEKEIDTSILSLIEQIDKTHKEKIKQFATEKKSVQGASIKKIFMLGDALAEARKIELVLKWRPKIGLIINSFICATSSTRNDLTSFIMDGVAQHGPSLNILSPYGKKLIDSTEKLNKFLQKKYALSNFLQLNNQINLNTYFVTEKMRAKRFKYLALLLARGYTQEPIFYMTLHDKGLADCAEAGILHLIASILFDPESGLLSEKKLPDKLKNQKTILEFVSFFNTSGFQNTFARHWWFDMLSHQKGIEYLRNNCSVRASIANILTMLNIFFGIHAKTWQELGEQLSTKTTTISFSSKTIFSKDTKINLINKNEIEVFNMVPLIQVDQLQLSIETSPLKSTRISTIYIQQFKNDCRHVEIVNEQLQLHTNKTRNIIHILENIKTPASIFTPLTNWTHNEFSVFTEPSINPKRELATILGRPLATKSFFEFVRFMEYNSSNKNEIEFIKHDSIKPSPKMTLSSSIIKWLSENEMYYKKLIYHPFIKNHINLFLQNTYQNSKYNVNQKKAFIYALNNFFDKSNATLFEQAIRTIFEQSVNSLSTNKIPKVISQNFERYPYAWCREAKIASVNNLQNHIELITLFIIKDRAQKNVIFSKDNPSMLYLLLQEAIDGSKKEPCNRKHAKITLLTCKNFLNNKVFENKTAMQIVQEPGLFKNSERQKKIYKKLQEHISNPLEKIEGK